MISGGSDRGSRLGNLSEIKDLFLWAIVFCVAVFASNRLVLYACRRVFEFRSGPNLTLCPRFWPISTLYLRAPPALYKPGLDHFAVAGATILLFFLALWILSRSRHKVWMVILAGTILIVGTNLTQGKQYGLETPINEAGFSGENQYYYDAITITNPRNFLATFVERQSDLHKHSKTHPPGAVLSIYFILRALGDSPSGVSIAIAVLSASLSTVFLYLLLQTELKDGDLAGYLTFLYLLIPSIQIYYLASIDALITSFMLGTLYFFIRPNSLINMAGAIFFLFLSSFLTFLSLFILPVLAGYEFLREQRIPRSLTLVLGVGGIYLVLFFFTGFNYVQSFFTASAVENPQGFILLADPITYLLTRLEDVLEIAVLLGPFLLVLMTKGMIKVKGSESPLVRLSLLALGSLLAMLLVGVFKTGGTARGGMFIYPYLIFPVAIYLKRIEFPRNYWPLLASLIFGQSILMQMIGNFVW